MLSRRAFTGGLFVSVAALRAPGKEKALPEHETKDAQGLSPNLYIHVASDGQVTVACARSEMGQGVRSTLPVLLADELGADPTKILVVQGDGDKRYGDQNTDGSSSVRAHYKELRKAAATARELLIAAAAAQLRVSPRLLVAHDDAVWYGAKKLPFGKLADAAGKLPVPKDVEPRDEKELLHVFRELPDVDARAIATGKALFGADLRLPGMLIAVIARPKVVGGLVKSLDDAQALAIPGVKKVVRMPAPQAPWKFQPWGGVAVLADNTWAAMRGRAALKIEWENGPNASYDSEKFRGELSQVVREPGTAARNVGDVEAALKSAAQLVEAEYHVPHLAHVPMEPPVALARYEDGVCEAWASTQNPQAAQQEIARVLGIPEERTKVHVTFLGGAFGRKSKADFVSEAAWLAHEAGVPVRVQFTREDDLQHDYYNACDTQLLTAGLDAQGAVQALRWRTALTPIGSLFSGAEQAGPGDLQQGVTDLPLAIPHVRAETCRAPAHVRVGWLRSVYNIFHAFAFGSFADELAAARKKDPLDNLRELYGPPRIVTLKELGIDKLPNYGASLDEHPVDTSRLRAVLEKAAEMAGWEHRNGRALGIAAHRSFLTCVAAVVSVVKKDGRAAVDEVWIAYDAGKVLNPERARSQMEGAAIFGMSHAFYGGATMKAGVTEQSNFRDYRLVRMSEAPRAIHVERIESTHAPGGIGEPGVPPIAPALANAIFALTGERHRAFPFFPL